MKKMGMTIILLSLLVFLAGCTSCPTSVEATGIVEFYCAECPYCQKMIPTVSQVEQETGITIQKIEVWHNDNNARLFNRLRAEIEAACGGFGVPTFYNFDNGDVACGEMPVAELTAFVLRGGV